MLVAVWDGPLSAPVPCAGRALTVPGYQPAPARHDQRSNPMLTAVNLKHIVSTYAGLDAANDMSADRVAQTPATVNRMCAQHAAGEYVDLELLLNYVVIEQITTHHDKAEILETLKSAADFYGGFTYQDSEYLEKNTANLTGLCRQLAAGNGDRAYTLHQLRDRLMIHVTNR
jgi:hypothetical protein